MKHTDKVLPHVRLQFHIDNPALDTCWMEGYHYATDNLSEEDNPYEENSTEAEYWSQGWWAGLYGEPPLLAAMNNSEISELPKVPKRSAGELAAANEEDFSNQQVRRWAGRVAKIAGAIAATVAAVELIDMAS